MDINQLINVVKQKIENNIKVIELQILDKSFLHKKHKNFHPDKFHIKIKIKSDELNKLSKIEATRKLHSILGSEIKNNIHSLEILFI
tara:strand:+ start:304 stop:564 length:261 start_codon:yes stop_codon:yes gene_type:complete